MGRGGQAEGGVAVPVRGAEKYSELVGKKVRVPHGTTIVHDANPAREDGMKLHRPLEVTIERVIENSDLQLTTVSWTSPSGFELEVLAGDVKFLS